ncbi:MAG: EAL domain-containing protein [Spirochaetia bacterium]
MQRPLQIDQSFVRRIGEAPRMDALADAIIAMARSLGIGAVAEGVETEGQRVFLQSKGCIEGQGYLFSKPVPQDGLLRFLRVSPTAPTPETK